MLFNQLKNGDEIYILEVVGTFKKTTEFYVGTVSQVSNVYDEPLPNGQFQIPNQPRKRLVDITVSCAGESKKFTVSENQETIRDAQLGLTITTNRGELIGIVRSQYDLYKSRKEQIAKCDEEMTKCQQLLDKLNKNDNPKEDARVAALQKEVDELKHIIRKANQMVPPPMREMIPQDMRDVMNRVDQ